MNLRRLASLLALALASGVPASAQAQPKAGQAPSTSTTQAAPAAGSSKHNSNAPIDWDANRIEVQDRDHRATLSGNVRVRQQEMTLTADRVTANYSGSIASGGDGGQDNGGGGPQVHRLDATGNVIVTRPTEVARGQYGIYDLDKKLITLIGGVSLDRNGSVVRGGRLVVDLNTGRANMDGSAVGGNGPIGSGGRVSGRFTVAQHDAAASGGTADTSAKKPGKKGKPVGK
jgi:lipopolysaccharide export system protein LptA